MAPTQTSQFKALTDPGLGAVLIARGSSDKLAGLLEDLPVRLAPGGTYILSLSGTTLHIYERESGVTKFTTEKGAGIKSIDVDGDETTLTLGQRGISEIILHRTPGGTLQGATPLEDLQAPVSAMKEFVTLSGRGNLSPAERVRKAELLKEIQQTFAKAERVEQPKRTVARSVPASTGESRGGGGGYRYSG